MQQRQIYFISYLQCNCDACVTLVDCKMSPVTPTLLVCVRYCISFPIDLCFLCKDHCRSTCFLFLNFFRTFFLLSLSLFPFLALTISILHFFYSPQHAALLSPHLERSATFPIIFCYTVARRVSLSCGLSSRLMRWRGCGDGRAQRLQQRFPDQRVWSASELFKCITSFS